MFVIFFYVSQYLLTNPPPPKEFYQVCTEVLPYNHVPLLSIFTCTLHQVIYSPCITLQTWDLLRITVKGFLGFCQDFIRNNPGYYIRPVRINGSVVESLFSRFKYHASGNLSSVNYRGCVAKMVISNAVKKGEKYRSGSISSHGVLTKKKAKRK